MIIQNENQFPAMSLRKVKLSQSYLFKLLVLMIYIMVLICSFNFSIYLINHYDDTGVPIIMLVMVLLFTLGINIRGLMFLIKQKARYVVVSDKKEFTTNIYKHSYEGNHHEHEGIVALRDIEIGPFNVCLNYWQKSIHDPSKSEYVFIEIPRRIYHVENRIGEDILDANSSTKFTAIYVYSDVGKMSLFSSKIKPTDYIILYAVIIRITNIMD